MLHRLFDLHNSGRATSSCRTDGEDHLANDRFLAPCEGLPRTAAGLGKSVLSPNLLAPPELGNLSSYAATLDFTPL